MYAVGEYKFLSDGKMKIKLIKRNLKKNLGIPVNSPILVKSRQLAILVKKMPTGHEEKKILRRRKS